jgi:hypothetical protein
MTFALEPKRPWPLKMKMFDASIRHVWVEVHFTQTLRAYGIKEMWIDEKWTLNALWIMLHGLLDFMLVACLSDEQVSMVWSPRGEPNMKFVRPWAQKSWMVWIFFNSLV